MSDFIDLGKKMGDDYPSPVKTASSDKKVYYPSCYISGVNGLDVETGDEVVLKGKVTSVTMTDRDGKKSYSCDIEVTGLKSDGESSEETGLDSAMKKIEKKKAEADDEEEEQDE